MRQRRVSKLGVNTYVVIDETSDLSETSHWRAFMQSERSRQLKEHAELFLDTFLGCAKRRLNEKQQLHRLWHSIRDHGYCCPRDQEIRLNIDTEHLVDGTHRSAILYAQGLPIPAMLVQLLSNGVTT